MRAFLQRLARATPLFLQPSPHWCRAMPTAAAEGKRPKGKHGVHVAASPGPDRFLFSDLPTREVKALIRAALPAGDPVKLVLAVTAKGRWRGWAKITAGDEARAAAVVAKLNGAVVKRAECRCARRAGSGGWRTTCSRSSTAGCGKASNSTRQPRTLPWTSTPRRCWRPSWRASTPGGPGDALHNGRVRLHRRVRRGPGEAFPRRRRRGDRRGPLRDALRKNVLLCGADVTVHQGDYNTLWDTHTLRQDVVFRDVPWDGPEYVEEGATCARLARRPPRRRVLRLRRRVGSWRAADEGPFDVDAFAASSASGSRQGSGAAAVPDHHVARRCRLHAGFGCGRRRDDGGGRGGREGEGAYGIRRRGLWFRRVGFRARGGDPRARGGVCYRTHATCTRGWCKQNQLVARCMRPTPPWRSRFVNRNAWPTLRTRTSIQHLYRRPTRRRAW